MANSGKGTGAASSEMQRRFTGVTSNTVCKSLLGATLQLKQIILDSEVTETSSVFGKIRNDW